MKITIEIEVEDQRTPPPGAYWGPKPDHGERELRSIVSWAEKSHYVWENAKIVADGDVTWEYAKDQATPKQIAQMRRDVVLVANGGKSVYGDRAKMRLGKEYKAIVEEYEADPNAEWVKKLQKSIRASQRREQKQKDERETERTRHANAVQHKHDFMRDLIKDENVHQLVLESQGGIRIDRHRIRVMVESRCQGHSKEDPTPTTPAEEALWKRICRAAEATATFKLPKRFMMMPEQAGGRTVMFDF